MSLIINVKDYKIFVDNRANGGKYKIFEKVKLIVVSFLSNTVTSYKTSAINNFYSLWMHFQYRRGIRGTS